MLNYYGYGDIFGYMNAIYIVGGIIGVIVIIILIKKIKNIPKIPETPHYKSAEPKLSNTSSNYVPYTTAADKNLKFCYDCGAPVDPLSKFCRKCGASFDKMQ
jgi:hypothetical protein